MILSSEYNYLLLSSIDIKVDAIVGSFTFLYLKIIFILVFHNNELANDFVSDHIDSSDVKVNAAINILIDINILSFIFCNSVERDSSGSDADICSAIVIFTFLIILEDTDYVLLHLLTILLIKFGFSLIEVLLV